MPSFAQFRLVDTPHRPQGGDLGRTGGVSVGLWFFSPEGECTEYGCYSVIAARVIGLSVLKKISHENISGKRAASGGAGLNVSGPAIGLSVFGSRNQAKDHDAVRSTLANR